MSVTSEIQNAANAIREHQSPEATLLHALAGLLDQIALTTPASAIESQAGPIVRRALLVARAYTHPAGFRMCTQCGAKVAQRFSQDGKAGWCGDVCETNWRGSEYRGWYPR